jgi:hypothetical protein
MIRHIEDLDDGATLGGDVAIIGAGFAGLDLALFLADRGQHVVLLESGRLQFDPATQELARFESIGRPLRTPENHQRHLRKVRLVYEGWQRARQLGGTTNLWTGKWRTFDAWDFEERPWFPHSGWPIGLRNLEPYYAEIARDYGVGDLFAERGSPWFKELVAHLAPHGLMPQLTFRQAHPTRAAPRAFRRLKESPLIDLVLGANATGIGLHPDHRTVETIRLMSLDGRAMSASAGRFVLALGGLEVPRFLLACNHQIPTGIGNGCGLVGRFFMDRPKHPTDRPLQAGGMTKRVYGATEKTSGGRFEVTVALSPEVQRAEGLPNHAVFMKGSRSTPTPYRPHLAFEQFPNPESRVSLGTVRDRLGVPRSVVDWRITENDRSALEVMQKHLVRSFASAGLGRLEFESNPITYEEMHDGAHHMGATRMAAHPSQGVVDANCRVFGTENLFVASSSVFVTGGAYSPTFTILALTRRLGYHLLETDPGGQPEG